MKDPRVEGPLLGQGALCEPIFAALPDWFGIEEANRQYVTAIDVLPTFVVMEEGRVLGFLTLKLHFPWAAEIYVMGVRPETHRRGIGRALLASAEAYLREHDVEFLQVKTLSPSHPDPFYAHTRAFYAAEGFRPLEELKTLWDAKNPCLMMVKRL
jgi:ribosomal protein S18 acetylase RimI-like enzyme